MVVPVKLTKTGRVRKNQPGFCDDDCRGRYFREAYRAGIDPFKECERCGKKFMPTANAAKFCGEFCSAESKRERSLGFDRAVRAKKRADGKQCDVCSERFIPRIGMEKFCSDRCRLVHQKPFLAGMVKKCAECGISFSPRHWTIVVCGNSCRLAANRRAFSKPKCRTNNRVRCGMRRALTVKKGGRHWETLVDFTLEQLMSHLESQFVEGMSWQNMDEWHIDHKRPLSWFNFDCVDDAEFKAAWSLRNLQPLWKQENLSKGARYGSA